MSTTPSHGSFGGTTWNLGDLGQGSSATLTVVVTVGPSAVLGTDIVTLTSAVLAADETLVNTGDDSATETTSIETQTDLAVSMTESVDPVVAGSGAGNLSYTVTVSNEGPRSRRSRTGRGRR